MDDLIERLAMELCLAEHDEPESCDEPALRHWRLPARLVLAEIGRDHLIVPKPAEIQGESGIIDSTNDGAGAVQEHPPA